MAWLWFAVVQLVSLIAMVAGIFILTVPSLLSAWAPDKSGNPQWTWPINYVYGNPEDGVVGPIWHMPGQPDWLRAYMWSAWRNSCDGLKYAFYLKGGPFKRWTVGSWYAQLGWNSSGLPVLSAGRI